MASPEALRHLARLAGMPPIAAAPDAEPDPAAIARTAAADPGRVAAGLTDEALRNDDVTSAAAARAFVRERLAEWADLLAADLCTRIAEEAETLIEQQAPE